MYNYTRFVVGTRTVVWMWEGPGCGGMRVQGVDGMRVGWLDCRTREWGGQGGGGRENRSRDG